MVVIYWDYVHLDFIFDIVGVKAFCWDVHDHNLSILFFYCLLIIVKLNNNFKLYIFKLILRFLLFQQDYFFKITIVSLEFEILNVLQVVYYFNIFIDVF